MLSEWADFFVATAGAAAALGGLIIVAVSVSVTRMISIPGMTSRAGVGIVLLVLATIVALAGLVPGQAPFAYGLVVAIAGGIALVFAVHSLLGLVGARRAPHAPEAGMQRSLGAAVLKGAAGVLPAGGIVLGGLLVMAGSGVGLYWIAGGVLVAVCSAVLSAWVVLVEIRR